MRRFGLFVAELGSNQMDKTLYVTEALVHLSSVKNKSSKHYLVSGPNCSYTALIYYFSSSSRGMFTGGLREMQQTEIPIHGVTHTAMIKLLDFIYTSELELDLDTVQEVLCAATLLQVKPSSALICLCL